MLICHCNGVNDRKIRHAVREGADTPDEVGRACGAGTCCGGCSDAIRELIHAEAAHREAGPGRVSVTTAPAT